MTQTITRAEQLDPRSLLVDVNVRTDAQLDKQFVGSIRDHGVLVPIVAVDTPDGVRVRFGHRRTLAACEAGLETVPVLIVDPATGDPDSEAAEIDRIVTQHVENTHRAGLTTADQVGVARQLTAFGLSVHQIARRTRTKRTDIARAVAVAGSELAAQATARYDLTLDQAAILAEFDDDPDTAKALVAAAKTGQFEHVAQRARDQRAEHAAYTEAAAGLEEQRIPVVDRPEWNDRKVRPIRQLKHGRKRLTAETHADCPGRAAYINTTRDWHSDQWKAETVEVCVDYPTHGHTDPDDTRADGRKSVDQMTDGEREQAREQRRLVIEHNKAWASATDVRLAWLRDFLTRKTPPKGTAPFVAGMLASDPELLVDYAANRLAAELLGHDQAQGYGRSPALRKSIDAANDKRAEVITLALLFAACEAAVTKGTWRRDGTTSWHGTYLRFLADQGYTLAEVEDYAASDQTV